MSKKYKYKLMGGAHSCKDEKGNLKTVERGDTFECDHCLSYLNSPGSIKVLLIDGPEGGETVETKLHKWELLELVDNHTKDQMITVLETVEIEHNPNETKAKLAELMIQNQEAIEAAEIL